MKNKSKKCTNSKEKKNLAITNNGDYVTIKNRSAQAASIISVMLLVICIMGVLSLKEAWDLPLFWGAFSLLIVAILYSIAKVIFGKIDLNSPEMLMTVYNPFKKTYKFEEINYIDVKTSKTKDGNMYSIIVYIGDGKRSVQITTTSSIQADEVASLLRGMLDNGAMEYPEGNEEPFVFDDDKKKTPAFLGLHKKKKEKDESVNTKPEGTDEITLEKTDSPDKQSMDNERPKDEPPIEEVKNEDDTKEQ